ncbi:Smr/MutS family protein [Candidatus Pelagibacter communis]|uniref:Smr/MutS family protein n=1 Tax=Pelagibacter ubique TaxID=198252 RepID=UPI00065B455B|nr:Smr/MutS family protein [Candidatus Pelagibacter ubique]
MNNNFSGKDKKDWENFLSSKEKLIDKENYIKKKTTKISYIDLHGYTLDDANKKIEKFIKESFENNINLIRVITGKGLHSNNESNPYISKDLSILKYSVPEYIKNNNELMKLIIEFKKASIEDGGEGAFYILLKKNKIK